MAARKKQTNGVNGHAATVAKGSTVSDLVDSDGFYCVKGSMLWKYRAVDAEVRNAMLSLRTTQEAIAREIAAHPTLRGLFADEKGFMNQLSIKKGELATVHKEISEHFGVDLKNCSIDDDTGRLYVLGEGGGEPTALRPTVVEPQPKKRTAAPRRKSKE